MIICLMYYEGDLEVSMSLARFLADIEPSPRDDVVLALVRQPDTPTDNASWKLVEHTIAHCSRKFTVESVASPIGAKGHPAGCTALWTGSAQYYLGQRRKGLLGKHPSIFMLDANDGIPLHSNWISMSLCEHQKTLGTGKLITGSPYFQGTCPLHVNPNAIYNFEVFERTKMLVDVPTYDGTLGANFDIYHREEMLAHSRLTSVVRTDWRGGGQPATRDLLLERSKEHIWLHGYKDAGLHWLGREHLVAIPQQPQIREYDLPSLRKHETVRRHYEEGCRQ